MYFFKKIFGLIFVFTILLACNDHRMSDKNFNQLDSNEFEMFVNNYKPNHIDLSKDLNDTLKYFHITDLFGATSNFTKSKWVHKLLLKQYLYHLKTANQGYGLYSMRKGYTSLIINYFIEENGIDPDGEFLNSGVVVHKVSNNQMLKKDTAIITLLKEIKKEDSRIIKNMQFDY